MKKIVYVLFAAAAVLASACSKIDTQTPVAGLQDQSSKFVFDITVGSPDTRAVKTDWEEGDQFLIFFENDVTLGHQLRLTYNGCGWTGRFDDEQFADTFTAGSKGRIYGIHYPGTITATQENGEFLMKTSGIVIMARSIDYSVSESDGRLKFSAALTTSLQTNMQIVVTGDDVNVDDSWTLKSYYRKYDNGVIGCDLNSCATCYFGGNRIGNYASYVVPGVQNADGIAFNFRYDYAGRGDVVLVLENSKKGKTYYRVIPEGKLPTQDQVTNGTGKAYKMALSSFVEQTENTGLVRDVAYHYYNTVTLNDGKTWMADNYRYVPDGMSVTALASSYTPDASTGIWYPATFGISEANAAVVTPSDNQSVIAAQGLLYSAAVALAGEAIPTKPMEDCVNKRGICPEGWHIPTAKEWIDLVGACATKEYNNVEAPYYEPGLSGASLSALNAGGFRFLPYPYLNQGKSYLGSYLNKDSSREFYGYPSLSYFHSSTGYSATQSYAAMITNNGTKSSVNVAYNNLLSGISVRCVKD